MPDPPRFTKQRLSLRTYITGFVVVCVAAVSVAALYARSQWTDDTETSATQAARFAALVSARQIASSFAQVQQQVEKIATTPGITAVFAGPSSCTLSFAGAGGFTQGHIDVVGYSGKVGCTSLAEHRQVGYAGATWFESALTHAGLGGPVRDPRTGDLVMYESVPISGLGTVLAFLDLDSLGPGLAALYGGPQDLEFLVTSPNGKTIVARSIDPKRWVGKSVATTKFATKGGATHAIDVTGTARLYGEARVPGAGLTVYAGASVAGALASVHSLETRELWMLLVGLLVILAAAWGIYRRIARPVEQLSSGVRAATADAGAGGDTLSISSAPREVGALLDDFNTLVATVERELHAASRLAALVESSDDAIIGTDLEGLVTSWNTGAERIYGYLAAEVVGHPATLLLAPEPGGDPDELLRRIAAGSSVPPREVSGLRKGGEEFPASLSISPVRDRSETVVGAAAVIRDVTQAKQEEAERAALQDRLELSLRLESLGQLAGGVAHDFNNLLGAIINYAEFVRQQVVAAELEDAEHWAAVRRDVEQIALAAERATRLTHQLLAFARRDMIQPETLDVNTVVRGIEPLLRRTIGEDIEMNLSLEPELSPTTIDPGHLEQVLVNLAVNSRDAMPSGGDLTIHTANIDVDAMYAAGRPNLQPGPYVQLRVSDTGNGMGQEVIERAFEPFYTTKPKGEGTGLGLATIYGIVTQAGGAVAIYSEPGMGTTVTVLLPEATDAMTRREDRDAAPRHGDGQTLLVVEDEEALREVTCRILEGGGYRVVTASGGEAAIALLGELEGDLDLLLTDVVMPRMLGKELAERVLARHPGTAVLFMSGYAESVLDARGRLEPGVTLITKPFSQSSLLEKVAEVLTSSR